jgi:hypothetical protein
MFFQKKIIVIPEEKLVLFVTPTFYCVIMFLLFKVRVFFIKM